MNNSLAEYEKRENIILEGGGAKYGGQLAINFYRRNIHT